MTELRSPRASFLSRIRLPFRFPSVFNRKSLIILAAIVLLIYLIAAWQVHNQAGHLLEDERELLAKVNNVPFEKRVRPALASKELEIWQSYQNARAIVRFKDSYFVASDGGLLELTSSGDLLRHYSVLDGLPESDLLSVAFLEGKLFIGTRTQGLASFDGERFEVYRWTDRDPQAINALIQDTGRLLIGTMAGGLIEFDGRHFKEIKVGGDRQRLSGINYLSKDGLRLYIGTFADGLWIEEGARWFHFTVADGLLSNRIVGVVATHEYLFVASDYGITVAPFSSLSSASPQTSPQLFRSVATLPSLSSMVEYRSKILLCKDDGATFSFPTYQELPRSPQLNPVAWNKPANLVGCRLTTLDRELWLLSNDGIRSAQVEAPETNSRRPAISFSSHGQMNDSHSLASNLISALTFDSQGRLWAGSFRNGIDVLSPKGKPVAHLESEVVREINFLVADRKASTMLAATSQGLLRFDGDLRAIERWSTADGLLSNSILQIALTQTEEPHSSVIACATSKGLSLGLRGKLRGLTTVQGLPSNSLYTVLIQDKRIYAGTLGGLAVIEDGRVVRVFKDSNSKLTHNWVTAIYRVGSRVFIGSYGGGIFELTASGEVQGFSAEAGRAIVNPNAMWSDGERLYSGTLDGVLVLDLHSQKWTRLRDELPSRTVLSVTGDEKYVYVGTTGGIARIEHAYWDRVTLSEKL